MTNDTLGKIGAWMGRYLPSWLFNIALFLRICYKKIKMPEQKKSFGDLNPDKTFYVIRLFPPATGFLANYNYVLGYMHYAYQKGYIPVIDMENYGTLYQEVEAINGTRNVWEYYFEQPLDKNTNKRYSLQEVYKSKNVILSDGSEKFYDASMNNEVLEWQHEMSLLVPFKKDVQKRIDTLSFKVLPFSKKILGVPTRGSEQKKRIIGHPIPLNVDEILPIIKDRMAAWNISDVFVKAEEQETIEYLKNNLPNVHYTEQSRITNYDVAGAVPASNAITSVSKYQSLLEYLTDIAILSKCDSVLGTMNNGLYSAVIWNGGKFTHVEVIDNGRYK